MTHTNRSFDKIIALSSSDDWMSCLLLLLLLLLFIDALVLMVVCVCVDLFGDTCVGFFFVCGFKESGLLVDGGGLFYSGRRFQVNCISSADEVTSRENVESS